MPLIIDDGTGIETANSFASVAFADAYHAASLYSAGWTAASEPRKEAALIMATRLLVSSVVFPGRQTFPGVQGLPFPRECVTLDGVTLPNNITPTPIKNATAELAKLLLAEDLTIDPAQNDLKLLNLGKGALEIEFREGTKKKTIPTIISTLLMGLGRIPSGNGIVQVPIGNR